MEMHDYGLLGGSVVLMDARGTISRCWRADGFDTQQQPARERLSEQDARCHGRHGVLSCRS